MTERDDRRRHTRCSFCGKGQEQVRKLVAGPGVYICDQCIDLCQEVLEEDNRSTSQKRSKPGTIPNPQVISASLDQYVVGQEHAKKVLSVAVFNHYKRIAHAKTNSDVELQKSNVLLVGPTGCGKTLLAQTLARIIDVPIRIVDAKSITEHRVGNRTNGINRKPHNVRNKDTTRILRELQAQDLLKYGLIPEFVGRLPITVALAYLDEEDVIRILTEPKNAFVKQYQKFFSLDDVELVFHEGALRAIAQRALARGTGARGLKSIIEDVLLNSMFEVPSRPDVKRCVITEQSILDGVEPLLLTEEPKRRVAAGADVDEDAQGRTA